MNLKERAAREGVGYATARHWFTEGLLPVPARKAGGLILVGDAAPAPSGVTAVYTQASSADQEPDLDRQVARVTARAAAQGLTTGKVVTEAGSALDGKRRRSPALLCDPPVTVTGHRDRFARFGAGYVAAARAAGAITGDAP